MFRHRTPDPDVKRLHPPVPCAAGCGRHVGLMGRYNQYDQQGELKRSICVYCADDGWRFVK